MLHRPGLAARLIHARTSHRPLTLYLVSHAHDAAVARGQRGDTWAGRWSSAPSVGVERGCGRCAGGCRALPCVRYPALRALPHVLQKEEVRLRLLW